MKLGKNKMPIVIVVGVMIDINNKVLLGRRKVPKIENMLYGFPGGKVNEGEFLEIALEREIFEETGCTTINRKKLGITEIIIEGVGHLIAHFYLIESWYNQPIVKEPDKCYVWEWFNITNLPLDKTKVLEQFERTFIKICSLP